MVRTAPARIASDDYATALERAAGLATSSGLAGMSLDELGSSYRQFSALHGQSAIVQAMAAAGMLAPLGTPGLTRFTSDLGGDERARLMGTLGRPTSSLPNFSKPAPSVMENFPLHPPPPPDPYTFYFGEGRRGEDLAFVSFTCGEFRHRGDPQEFSFELLFVEGAVQTGGQLDVEVHARNLRDRVRCKIAVARKVTDCDVMSHARVALGLSHPGQG